MGEHFLYSTNVYLKQHIQRMYAGDVHYVWCSENFDARTTGSYTPGHTVASSSNPADIYRELLRDVTASDKHSAKINAQKVSFGLLADEWQKNGKITAQDRDDMLFYVQTASFDYWRPLIYVIPRALVAGRMQKVPANKCAGMGPEFIVPDLKRGEFDLIEIPR